MKNFPARTPVFPEDVLVDDAVEIQWEDAMSDDTEQQFFQLSEAEKDEILAAMASCDGEWWLEAGGLTFDDSGREKWVGESLLNSGRVWVQAGLKGAELAIRFHPSVTRLGDLSPLQKVGVTSLIARGNPWAFGQLSSLSALQGFTTLKSLDLSYCPGLTDLAPLKGLSALTSLKVSGCQGLTDLAPLKGLSKLKQLYLYGLSDLSPLTALPALTRIKLHCRSEIDLSPLQGLTNLDDIDLSECEELTDITALHNLSNLTRLNLSQTSIEDLSPLRNLTNLADLDLSECEGLTDITALQGLSNLTRLNLSQTSIEDLSPLRNLTNLTRLNLRGRDGGDEFEIVTRYSGRKFKVRRVDGERKKIVIDLSPLNNLTALTYLDLSRQSFADTSPIQNLSSLTEYLSLSQTSIEDLSPLRNLTNLRRLNISKCEELTDITALHSLSNLIRLNLSQTSIEDLSPLRNLTNLADLDLSECEELTDITALHNLSNLTRLNLSQTSIEDLSPLRNLTNLADLNLSGRDEGYKFEVVERRVAGERKKIVIDLSPLKNLTALTYLDLSRQSFADTSPIQNLRSLTQLVMQRCEGISHLNLDGLTALTDLRLSKCNALAQLSLHGLSALATLDLHELTALTDLRLSECNALAQLSLHGLSALTKLSCNSITDITPLSELTALTTLDLSGGNIITDITPLSKLTALTTLDLSGCSITDITPLSKLTALTWLNLSKCREVWNFEPLSHLNGLRYLNASHTNLFAVSALQKLTALEMLRLAHCVGLEKIDELGGLAALTKLDLSDCSSLSDLQPLQHLSQLSELSLRGCRQVVRVGPLAQLQKLQSLDLKDCPNVRDLDLLASCEQLRELTWTQKVACQEVLAATAAKGQDKDWIAQHIDDWVQSIPFTKIPDVYIQRLLTACALGGRESWAIAALTAIANQGRARGLADEEHVNSVSPATWAFWAKAVLGLDAPRIREPIAAAFRDLDARREINVVLFPVLLCLANFSERLAHDADWVLRIVESTLAPLSKNENAAREIAPAAAVFYAAYDTEHQVNRWLDLGSHPHSPRWRDRVVLELLNWNTKRNDFEGAKNWFAQIHGDDVRDLAHVAFARMLAQRFPVAAVTEHLECIADENLQAELAAELARMPEVTGTNESLYGVLLVVQQFPETLADLLEILINGTTDQRVIADISEAFDTAANPCGPSNAALASLCTHPVVLNFLGRRSRPQLELLQKKLGQQARTELKEAFLPLVQLLIDEALLDADDAPELLRNLRPQEHLQ